MEYRVTWIIAENGDCTKRVFEHVDCPQFSYELAPDSLATHFIVRDPHGDDREVWADSKYP